MVHIAAASTAVAMRIQALLAAQHLQWQDFRRRLPIYAAVVVTAVVIVGIANEANGTRIEGIQVGAKAAGFETGGSGRRRIAAMCPALEICQNHRAALQWKFPSEEYNMYGKKRASQLYESVRLTAGVELS